MRITEAAVQLPEAVEILGTCALSGVSCECVDAVSRGQLVCPRGPHLVEFPSLVIKNEAAGIVHVAGPGRIADEPAFQTDDGSLGKIARPQENTLIVGIERGVAGKGGVIERRSEMNFHVGCATAESEIGGARRSELGAFLIAAGIEADIVVVTEILFEAALGIPLHRFDTAAREKRPESGSQANRAYAHDVSPGARGYKSSGRQGHQNRDWPETTTTSPLFSSMFISSCSPFFTSE